MHTLSRFLWSAMGSGKNGGDEKDKASDLEETDQVDFNGPTPKATDGCFEKAEKVALFFEFHSSPQPVSSEMSCDMGRV